MGEKDYIARIRRIQVASHDEIEDIVLGPGPKNAVLKLAASVVEASPASKVGWEVTGIEIEEANDMA